MFYCVFARVLSSAGRVLELLVLLDEHWQKHRLGSYKLVLLHNTAFNTAEFAKSQVSHQASQATSSKLRTCRSW